MCQKNLTNKEENFDLVIPAKIFGIAMPDTNQPEDLFGGLYTNRKGKFIFPIWISRFQREAMMELKIGKSILFCRFVPFKNVGSSFPNWIALVRKPAATQ